MAFAKGFRGWERSVYYGFRWSRNASRFTEERVSEESHAAKTIYLWKRISLFIAVPIVSYLTWKNFVSDVEHVEHREYHPWPHLRIRNKPFPWGDGDKTLFHNPHTNPGPEPENEDIEESASDTPSNINFFWQKYLFEDPVKRDQVIDNHLAMMQKRHEEYIAKKKMPENPVQPQDLVSEWKKTPVNPVESIQNST